MTKLTVGTTVEAGAGDISDPVISGEIVKVSSSFVSVKWNAQAWYTCGHNELEFGPLLRRYSRRAFQQLLDIEGYDRITIVPKKVEPYTMTVEDVIGALQALGKPKAKVVYMTDFFTQFVTLSIYADGNTACIDVGPLKD